VLLGPPGAGAGFSLKSLVETLRVHFAGNLGCQSKFTELLSASGYRDSEAQHYMRQFTLRRPLAVVAINDRFPAITRPVIQSVLGTDAQRIDHVQYDVNTLTAQCLLQSEISAHG
jgi:hypothetical protein